MILGKTTEPAQKHMNSGLFVVDEKPRNTSYGIKLVKTTRVTSKGQVYIIEKLRKEIASYASEISNRLNVNVEPIHLIQCLEIGITAFLLNKWGYVSEMQMSKEFVIFYNIVAFAFLAETEYSDYELSFESDEEFIKVVA